MLVVAAVALGVVVLAAILIAARLAAPLKRIERFASAVDAGDVDNRIDAEEGPAEIRSLSESFNHMLDRLQGSLTRQREFVADASHELRTPLTVARGEVDLMTRAADGEQRAHLETVGRELRRMDRLVNDMLTLAGADDGVALELEPIDLDDFLEDLERDLRLFGERKYSVARPSGVLIADRDRLTQVLRNLVRNSVAHTNANGHIHVGVRVGPGAVAFEVDDDGIGFSPGQAGRLFDRFYRTDQGRGRDSGRQRPRPRDRESDRRGPRWADLGRSFAGGRRADRLRVAQREGRARGPPFGRGDLSRRLRRDGLRAPQRRRREREEAHLEHERDEARELPLGFVVAGQPDCPRKHEADRHAGCDQ